MSVTVKIFGLAEYSSPTKIEAALKQFFEKDCRVPGWDTHILFIPSHSQSTGSPVLAEVSATKDIDLDANAIEELIKVLHMTSNRQINLAFTTYDSFISVDNPERNCKFHVDELAFPEWRKPVEA